MVCSPTRTEAFASLPWYDLAEIRVATDTLGRELLRQFRRAGVPGVPQQLNRDVAYDRQWTSSQFLFGQACGYDVRMAYADHLQVVATPCYGVPGCRGSSYSSYVIVDQHASFRDVDDLRGTRCVINTPTSHSGMNVLRALVAPRHCDGRFFSTVAISGSHERSLRMIRRGRADVAAIDCVTHALLKRYRPQELAGTRILHRTEHVPAPPYVTAASASAETVAAMRQAVLRAFRDSATSMARSQLLLAAVELLPDTAYTPIDSLASLAQDHDYREIPGRLSGCGTAVGDLTGAHDQL